MIDGLYTTRDLKTFCQVAADRVRGVVDCDRVIVYRFKDDHSGWIYVESRNKRIAPLLDMHYPPAHVPKRARALYLKNCGRIITQVGFETSSRKPKLHPRTRQSIHMIHVILRELSSVHRRYLRDLGVGAAMSMSIISEGKLWGLIACHHRRPRRLSARVRTLCQLFGCIFSLQLETREGAGLREARIADRQKLRAVMQRLTTAPDYAEGMVRELPSLRDYMSSRAAPSNSRTKGRELACGIAVRMNGRISMLGATPDREQIEAMSVWLAPRIRKSDGVFMTDRLGDLWAPAKAFAAVGAGLLVATVSRTSRDWVLWFSPEYVENIPWGSDPGKVTDGGPSRVQLTPDRLFQVWRQTVRGRSRPWLSRQRDAALDLHALLLGLALRRMEDAAREQAETQAVERLLMANLELRVTNALSTIQALVIRSSRTASALGDLTASIDRRIHSMERAHALLGDNRWGGAAVSRLIHAELDAYIHNGYDISISGPDVVLTPQGALAMALAIHELATNAAKFGSLSVPGGSVTIQWRLAAMGGVILEWREIGGPRVEPPTKRGFGSNLIETVLAMEPGGHSSHVFDCAGVTCEIRMPSSSVSRSKAATTETR